MRRASAILIIILLCGFGIVFARLFYLQVYMAEELQQRAVDQQLRDTTVSAKRGSIYDANGNILAQSISVWDVVLAPANFKKDDENSREIVAKGLSEILGVDKSRILEMSHNNDSYYEVLARKVDVETKNKVLKFCEEKKSKYAGADISTDIQEAQAYDDTNVNDRVEKAVSETRGLVLSYHGELPYAWFHAHSGGLTERAMPGKGTNPDTPRWPRAETAPRPPRKQGNGRRRFPGRNSFPRRKRPDTRGMRI